MSEDRDPAEGDLPSDSFDASDETQVRVQRRNSRLRKNQEKDFLGRALSDPIGRKFFWDLLSGVHVFDERFGVAGSANCPEATAHFRGEREAGLQWLRLFMRLQPALTAQMIAEHDNG